MRSAAAVRIAGSVVGGGSNFVRPIYAILVLIPENASSDRGALHMHSTSNENDAFGLKRETTRCRARTPALGTLPLDPSQAVRQGPEIETRSASSCCDRPVRLRAAHNMPPVISTIVMLRFFVRRQRTSMSADFTSRPNAVLGHV